MNLFIRRKENLIDPEEVLLDKKAKEKENEADHLESLQWPFSKKPIYYIFWATLIIISLIFYRSFSLMILKGFEYEARAINNKNRQIFIEAPRGIIYDRYLNPLVENQPSYSLMIIPLDLPRERQELDDLILKISKIFNYDYSNLSKFINFISEKNLQYSIDPILLKSDLDSEEIRNFEIEIGSNKGFIILPSFKRIYPYKDAFAHIIGYIGKITKEEITTYKNYLLSSLVGKTGLEKYYENELRGTAGKKIVELDANLKIKRVIQEVSPIKGKDLITTLDRDLQLFFYNSLKSSVSEYSAEGAAGIIINPKTGEILSLVSLDSFDPNVFVEGKDEELINKYLSSSRYPLFNRVVSGIYQPGSLIKPLMASAALEEKIIDPNKKIYDEGEIIIVNPYNPEIKYVFKDWKNHGWVDMRKAIAESCNFYFWLLGGGYKDFQGLGWKKIKEYWLKFGLGDLLGIDLPSESKGILPDPEYLKIVRPNDPNWRLGDTYNISIGTGGLSLTPLSMGAYISVIANDGILMKPHIVKEIDSEKEKKDILPEKIKEVDISKDNLKIVKEGMREVVLSGTATPLKDSLVEIAGKSGSPKYGSGLTEKYNAVFGAFAPYKDPEIVILIVIENPTSNVGSTLPVIKEVIEWYALNRLNKN